RPQPIRRSILHSHGSLSSDSIKPLPAIASTSIVSEPGPPSVQSAPQAAFVSRLIPQPTSTLILQPASASTGARLVLAQSSVSASGSILTDGTSASTLKPQ